MVRKVIKDENLSSRKGVWDEYDPKLLNDLTLILDSDNEIYVTSKQIADITGKNHFHVLRDIDKDLAKMKETVRKSKVESKLGSILEKTLEKMKVKEGILQGDNYYKDNRIVYLNRLSSIICLARYNRLVAVTIADLFLTVHDEAKELNVDITKEPMPIKRAIHNYLVGRLRNADYDDATKVVVYKELYDLLEENNDLKIEHDKVIPQQVADMKMLDTFYSLDDFDEMYFAKLGWSAIDVIRFFDKHQIWNSRSHMVRPLWRNEDLYDNKDEPLFRQFTKELIVAELRGEFRELGVNIDDIKKPKRNW